MPRFNLDYETADLIRNAFLPANPRKLRRVSPEVRRAVDAYLDALYVASDHQAPASPAQVQRGVGCEPSNGEKK